MEIMRKKQGVNYGEQRDNAMAQNTEIWHNIRDDFTCSSSCIKHGMEILENTKYKNRRFGIKHG